MCSASASPRLIAAMTSRTLTLLFTDMVGSTRLLADLPDHQAHRLRTDHFAELREQIERHAGREVKTLGDGVMASFDFAKNAIESAIAMQVVSARAARGASRQGPSIRIGLSSGDVRLEGGDCFGTPVIEASRLCHRAASGQVLVAESTRLVARGYGPLNKLGDLRLKGFPEPTGVWEANWSHVAPKPLRVVLADDAVLVREGIARVLEERGIEVLGQAGDADELLHLTAELRPDLAIVDVRMPPTHKAEGLEAAESILAKHPGTGVLLLSQDLEPRYATRLLAVRPSGVGYLLKERVADVGQFVDAASQVAGGGRAFEPALAAAHELTDRPEINGGVTDG
jgi:class 3 adenylate cyclase/CheY-like chemotaxis protein